MRQIVILSQLFFTKMIDLFSQKEPPVETTLRSFLRIINKLPFIENSWRVYQYSDEPKFYQFFTKFTHPVKIKNTSESVRTTAGTSFFSEDAAFLKSLGEAIERYASNTYKSSNLIKGSYKSLKRNAVNPNDFRYFSQDQLKQKNFRRFNFDSSTPFTWVWGNSLTQKVNILIPVHLVYYSYKFDQKEGILAIPISTGSAGGGCLASAIARGIFEVAERDSFMIAYLNKLPGYMIDLKKISDSRIKFILDTMRRYRLELYVIDLTTDLMIPSFVSIVIDRTGLGQAVHVGLKADFNIIKAIIGSIDESFLARQWMRTIFEDEYDKYKNIVAKNISSHEERGMYWYPVKQIKKLDFWLDQKPKPLRWPVRKKAISHGNMLRKLVDIFKKNKYEIYYVDITPKELKSIKYKVVKVIIPKLQPLYLTERYPYFGPRRLYDVPQKIGYKKHLSSFNSIPNPML